MTQKRNMHGLLLHGLPGTGKTSVAKAVALALKATFYTLDTTNINDKWVGESEK